MLKKQYSKTKPVCKVTFSLPEEAAPGAEDVRLLGDFNGWNWENGEVMKLAQAQYQASIELETGRSYEFRYLINGQTWVNDWHADDYRPSPFLGIDNSVVQVEAAKAKVEAKVKTEPKAKAKVEAKVEAKVKTEPKAKAKVEAKAPAKKTAPAKKVEAAKAADDLKKIEGIGPKIEQLLQAGGIATFEALAKAKPATVKGILEKAGPRYQMHDPATWATQAKLAAKGEWAKLEQLQGELKGGRKQ